jgi:hypothetical protein
LESEIVPKLWHQQQKERGVKLVLSWFAPRQCWKKYHDGKVKYFKHPNSAAGYEAAVMQCHAWLRQQKHTRPLAAEYDHHIQIFRHCLEWYERFGTPGDEEDLRAEIAQLVTRLEIAFESEEPLPFVGACLPDCVTLPEKEFVFTFCSDGIVGPDDVSNPFNKQFGSLGWSPTGVWQERVRQLRALASLERKLPQTVNHQAKRFLDFKEAQVRGGVLKARTWGTLAERLPFFVAWIKPGTHVSTINGNTLTGFYEWLLRQPWGHQRRKNIFNTSRQWIRWAWRQDDVELDQLPKNIDSREFVFLVHLDKSGVAKKTRTELLWTPDELHATLELVPEDFQLYLLLMLNCGFTNIDVGELLKSEVRLDEGRIVRQRTKTRRHEHPPVVNYKLWSRTSRLLRSQWSDHETLALTNLAGSPLCVSKLVEENGTTHETVWSSLGRRFQTMKKAKPKMPNKQMKFLRKTGSTKLKSDRQFFTLDTLYLGHSWRTIADKHYNAFDGEQYTPLDEATEWLGSEFGID